MSVLERFQNLMASVNNCYNENCDNCIDYEGCMIAILTEAHDILPKVYALLMSQQDKINFLSNDLKEMIELVKGWEDAYNEIL